MLGNTTGNRKGLSSCKLQVKRRQFQQFSVRNKILDSIGFQDYQEFLKSDLWKERRKKHYENPSNKFCLVCGSTKYLQVHHWHYRGLRKGGSKLFTLCGDCHQKSHKKTSRSVSQSTREFIQKWKKVNGDTAWEKNGGTITRKGIPIDRPKVMAYLQGSE